MTLDEITAPAGGEALCEAKPRGPRKPKQPHGTTKPTKPRGPMNAARWRRYSARRHKLGQDKQREATRHAKRMTDLQARSAAL